MKKLNDEDAQTHAHDQPKTTTNNDDDQPILTNVFKNCLSRQPVWRIDSHTTSDDCDG